MGMSYEQLRKLAEWTNFGEWELQTGCSWRRIGANGESGNVLRPDNNRHDGHPDLSAAANVLEYIIAAQPRVVIELLDRIAELEAQQRAGVPDAAYLAMEIRKMDGSNHWPVTAIAERIVQWLAAAPKAQEQCVCGESETVGVTHRTDGPCYQQEPAPQPAEVVTDERAKFEEWVKQQPGAVSIARYPDDSETWPGVYCSAKTDHLWIGWQARAQLTEGADRQLLKDWVAYAMGNAPGTLDGLFKRTDAALTAAGGRDELTAIIQDWESGRRGKSGIFMTRIAEVIAATQPAQEGSSDE